MMARSFSWRELPRLYDEYDEAAKLFSESTKIDNEREQNQLKRMYEIANVDGKVEMPLMMSFNHATILTQTFSNDSDIIKSLEKTGQYNKDVEQPLLERVQKAKEWLKLYAPDEYKFEVQDSVSDVISKKIGDSERQALKEFAAILRSTNKDDSELVKKVKQIYEKSNLQPKEFFTAAYLALLGKEKGPRLVPFVRSLGDKAIHLFESL